MTGRYHATNDGARWSLGILYVETGFVDLRPRPNLSVNYLPNWLTARVYYGEPQFDALNGACPKWLNRVSPSLDQPSCEAGPTPSTAIPQSDPDFPDQPAFYSKPFQAFVDDLGDLQGRHELRHPSVGYGTGKLKLYLQVLLGSIPKENYETRTADDELDDFSKRVIATVKGVLGTGDTSARRVWFPIDQNGLEKKYIAFNAMYSRGLFRTDDYRYWMILIDGNGLKAKELILKGSANALRRKLIEAGGSRPFAEETKIEAYLLYGATTFKDPITVDLNIFAAVRGDTIHEGWHFNLKGDEARIVTLESVLQGDSILHWVGRRYRLALVFHPTWNDGKGGFEATVEMEEEETCTPYSYVYAPMTEEHNLIWFQWNYDARPYVAVIEGDAPVYGFYGHDSSGQESYTTIRHATEFAGESRDLLAEINTIRASTYLCGAGGEHEDEIYRVNKTKTRNGFYYRVEDGSRSLHPDVVDPIFDAESSAWLQYRQKVESNGGVYGYCYDSVPGSEWTCGIEGVPNTFDQAMRNQYMFGDMFSILYANTPGASGVLTQVKTGIHTGYYATTSVLTQVRMGDCLVFPFSDSTTTYLYQLVTSYPNYVSDDYQYGGNVHSTSHVMGDVGGQWAPLATLDKDFAIYLGHPLGYGNCLSLGGQNYRVSKYWSELIRILSGWCVSGDESFKLFERHASQKGQIQVNYGSNVTDVYYIPGDPYTPDQQLGKHASLFDPDPDYPRFTAVEALESYGGHLAYMESFGPYQAQTAMPYDPILKIKDDSNERFPIAETGWNFLFEGWS